MKLKLKQLQIYGFKSFAEKTQFVFDKNITAIVGPNGCGKSNIVDAIYWVFQNHSLKSLRANEKQDLIFKGNDIKPPAGFAEVEIVFGVYDQLDDNGIDLENFKDEFSIKKRLYPSGEVIHYLNKKECRPKDIFEFLKNYSVSIIDYSIIGQGAISRIIDMKPEERVEMIETAAGIKNIKNERAKAFSDLSKAEENLKSITLLSEELENEVNKLKKQAEKAKIYKKANDDITFSEQAIQIIKYKKIIESLRKLEIDYQQSEENLKKIEEKTKEIESSKIIVNQNIKKLEDIIEEKKGSIYKIESEIAVIEKTILLSQKRFEELNIEKRRKLDDVQFFKNRLKKIEEFLSFPISDIKKELETELAKKEQLEVEIERLNEKLYEKNIQLENLNEIIKKLEKELRSLYKQQEYFINEEITNLFSNLYYARMKVINLLSASKNLEETVDIQKMKLEAIKKRIDDILRFKNSIFEKGISSFILEIQEKINSLFLENNNSLSKIKEIANEINEVEKMLFGKDSIFSKFQKYSEDISILDEKIEIEKNNQSYLQKEMESSEETKNNIMKRLEETNRIIFQLEEKLKNFQFNKSRYENEKVELNYNIQQKEEEISQIEQSMEKIKKEAIELIDQKDRIFAYKKELDLDIKNLLKEIDKYREELTGYLVENENVLKEKNNILSLRESFNILRTKLETQCETIKTSFYDNYRIVLSDDFIEDERFKDLKESDLRNKIFESRKILEEIGQVNFLAIEEFEEVSKRYDFINRQKEDIILTKEKILQIISDLDMSMKVKFMDAFNSINENFKNIFCEVFKGGNASMILTKPDNIFETGIEIIIQPPGKNISNISLLSGGETAMSSISLLFAFFLYRPSPFCIMDEVDAPFDENNVILFKRLIQRFSKDTQFFLISHNKLTLEIADVLYGITMEDDGISKVVSVKLEDIKDSA
ncbi:MAG: chromosome segregation SMC family protein [Exilispira sp.]